MSETKNAQEDIAFCHTIQSIRAKPKEHLNEQMAFNRESTFAERNLSGSTNYILQERKIFKRHTRKSQIVKVEYTTWARPVGVVLDLSTLQNICASCSPVPLCLLFLCSSVFSVVTVVDDVSQVVVHEP